MSVVMNVIQRSERLLARQVLDCGDGVKPSRRFGNAPLAHPSLVAAPESGDYASLRHRSPRRWSAPGRPMPTLNQP